MVDNEPGDSLPIDDATMREILGWDVRTWSKAVRLWNERLGASTQPLRVLELGAGPGGVSLWLASRGHSVVCTNLEFTAQQAERLQAQHPEITTVEYRDVDATKIPFENEFDIVVFKSVLGGLGSDPAGARATMAGIIRALKPGGRLLFAENMRGTLVHRWGRAIAYRARRASWRFLSVQEMRDLLAPFASFELQTTGVLGVFGVSESQRAALARVDDAFLNAITPERWRYVAYGIAVKRG